MSQYIQIYCFLLICFYLIFILGLTYQTSRYLAATVILFSVLPSTHSVIYSEKYKYVLYLDKFYPGPLSHLPLIAKRSAGDEVAKSFYWIFQFWGGSCQNLWWIVFIVSYFLVIFTDIPVCKQVEIVFVTEAELNTISFYNPVFDWQSYFAAYRFQCTR